MEGSRQPFANEYVLVWDQAGGEGGSPPSLHFEIAKVWLICGLYLIPFDDGDIM